MDWCPCKPNSLERAFNQAQQYSRKLDGWLLLQGGYGCGKTHLAAAIGNFAVGLGVPTLFVTVPDLLDLMRQSYGDKEMGFEERFDEIRRAPLLILDDFGTQNATPWAQEKLFQILNYRYINHLALVVTTNLSLREIEGRIRSRLAGSRSGYIRLYYGWGLSQSVRRHRSAGAAFRAAQPHLCQL